MIPAPIPATTVTGEAVIAVLAAHRFTYNAESQLQAGVSEALTNSGVPCQREAVLSATDRIDLLAGTVGVEVKVRGAAAAVFRQLQRYAHSPAVTELVLVTTRVEHATLPPTCAGVPLRVHVVGWTP